MAVSIERITEYKIDGITIRYEPRQAGQMYRKVVILRGAETIGIDYLNCRFQPSRKNAAYFCAKHVHYLAYINGEEPIYVNMDLWTPEPESAPRLAAVK